MSRRRLSTTCLSAGDHSASGVDEFTYLGSVQSSTGIYQLDILRRIHAESLAAEQTSAWKQSYVSTKPAFCKRLRIMDSVDAWLTWTRGLSHELSAWDTLVRLHQELQSHSYHKPAEYPEHQQQATWLTIRSCSPARRSHTSTPRVKTGNRDTVWCTSLSQLAPRSWSPSESMDTTDRPRHTV